MDEHDTEEGDGCGCCDGRCRPVVLVLPEGGLTKCGCAECTLDEKSSADPAAPASAAEVLDLHDGVRGELRDLRRRVERVERSQRTLAEVVREHGLDIFFMGVAALAMAWIMADYIEAQNRFRKLGG